MPAPISPSKTVYRDGNRLQLGALFECVPSHPRKPLAIDLYCGLGGWADGLLAEGWDVIGFDIEKHDYGTGGYPGQLVLQDVRSLHGSQFRSASLIVSSPPCQAYSYRAMPWSRAKALPPPDNSLFEACFRIQREACEATCSCACWRCKGGGHCVRCDCFYNTGKHVRHIPLIVENVRGAQKWVGQAAWHFGSYYLWGDVPALMPIALGRKNRGGSWFAIAHNTVSGHSQNPDGRKLAGQDWNNFRKSEKVSPHWRLDGRKLENHLKIRDGHSHTRHLTNPAEHVRIEESGVKLLSPGHYLKPGSGADWFDGGSAAYGSNSNKRKAAAAAIAVIAAAAKLYRKESL